MPKQEVSTRRLRTLADAREKSVSRSFLSSVRTLRTGVDYTALEKAIREKDYEAVFAACDVEEGAFSAVVTELRSVYAEAGQLTADMLTGKK